MFAYGYDLKRHSVTPGKDEVLNCFKGAYGFLQEGLCIAKGIEAAKEYAELYPYGFGELYIEVYSFNIDDSSKFEINRIPGDEKVYVFDLHDGVAHIDDELPSYYRIKESLGHVYRIGEDGQIERFVRKQHPKDMIKEN